ncbi:hypothetical protein [Vibrio sonorensis]|uniref:hypothetical protein n=1 Tax=Vibrio sonorensis TaxID=1004316 RepID=UPI001FDF4F34|nr:hypothetical protein [Vibrio sonorensis]
MYDVTISAMTGFEFKSKETSFNIYCVTKDTYEIIISGAQIHFPPSAAKLSVDASFDAEDMKSATFIVSSRHPNGLVRMNLNFPLNAARKLNEMFPQLNLM